MVDLREEKASPDFLGYTFRWHRDRYGRKRRYLHVGLSKKALQRERDRISVPEGMSYYEHLQRLGLKFPEIQPCESR